MKQYGFMFFLISGFCTLWPCLSLQYHLVEDEKSWSDAQSFCRQNYVDLASLLHQGQEALLPQSSRDAWIGLRGAWQWSLAHPDLYQEAEDSSLIWADGEPNNDGYENCAEMRRDGTFNDAGCFHSLDFICYNGGQTPEYFPISNQSLNWTEAQRYCKDQNYTGLAVIKKAEDHRRLREKLENWSSKNWWIGLSKIWMWYDQSQFSDHNWDETSTEGKDPICTAVGSTGKWKKEECSEKKPFYCYDGGQTPEYFPISNQSLNWTEAQRYCKDQNYTGLAVIKKAEDHRRLREKLENWSSKNWWIGLSKIWMWYDQSQFSDHNWDETSTEGKDPICTAVGSTGKWKKEECSEKKPFYCYDGGQTPEYFPISNQSLNWTEAQRYCKDQNYTGLAVIKKAEDHRRLREKLENWSSKNWWIGLSKIWMWYDQSQFSDHNWDETSTEGKDPICTAVGSTGKWKKEECSEKKPFYCYDGGQTPEYFPISNQSLNWTEAQRYCKDQNYTGLAVIKKAEDHRRLREKLENWSSKNWWIGLSKIWMWYDQSQFSDHNWDKTSTEGKDPICTAVGSTGKWKKEECSEKKPFYCYDGGQTPEYFPISNQSLNWTEAQRYCKDQNYTGLAVIKKAEDHRRLREKLENWSSKNWWIGLSKIWMWYDQSQFSDHNWDETSTEGKDPICTAVGSTGKWKKEECSEKKPFYCYDGGQTPEYFPISHQKLNWTEAQRYCKDQNYTGLAVIKKEEDHRRLREKLENWLPKKNWWIGLSKIWMWSDQSQFSYHNWNNTSTKEGKDPICTAVGSTGEWKKEECSEKKPFYCYDDDLILVKENRTWDEALDYCRRNHRDLVSVGSESLQHWVKRRAQQASTDHVWLGLRFTCALRFWHWVNADGVCYQNWASENLQEECGCMGAIQSRGGQKWYKLLKSERLNFICRK